MRGQENNDLIYPRAADEMYEIENTLGEAQVLFNIREQPSMVKIEDPLEEKPVEEVPEEKAEEEKKDGEEGEEEETVEPEEPEEGENLKPKFDPKEFDWTVSDGNPKNLPQVFNKKKTCIKVRTS